MSALPRPEDERYVPMTGKDLDEVVAAEKEVYPFPWTRGNFTDALQAGYSAWVLRNASGKVAAYSVMMIALDEAHLLNLSVASQAQRIGLGWRTLDWMADVARGYGGRTMLLEVRPSNEAAIRLYERYGFERIGVRRGYYPAVGGREDAIVLRVSL
ncbi:MAG: ribosomal protein S18-alanine N-acetyltransferase [Burkholderiaceae bacterium]